MRIEIEIDDDALNAWARKTVRLPQDGLREAIEKVAFEVAEPGAIEGEIRMGKAEDVVVGKWEMV